MSARRRRGAGARRAEATLHIVASVRAPCPTCSRTPCLVRMLYEPFTQASVFAPCPTCSRPPCL
eukprot:4698250-Prymnesium_polylepis.1